MSGAPFEAAWRAARGLVPIATLLLGVLLGAVPYGAPGLPAVMPALSLAGIPPFSGFVAKLALVEAGFALGRDGRHVLNEAAMLRAIQAG